jgi:hypothetical protein
MMLRLQPRSLGLAAISCGMGARNRQLTRAMRTLPLWLVVGLVIGAGTWVLRAQTKPTDWKLYGLKSVDADQSELFYESSQIKHVQTAYILVWTKELSANEIEAVRRAKGRDLIDRVERKVAVNYVPPYGRINKLSRDEMKDIISAEEIANDAEIQPRSQLLYELDCVGQMYRERSVYTASDGTTRTADTTSRWQALAPQTDAASLTALLCSR